MALAYSYPYIAASEDGLVGHPLVCLPGTVKNGGQREILLKNAERET
jgi:hypothetical protein